MRFNEDTRVKLPPMPILHELEVILTPILDKQLLLNKEVIELTKLRDWLLPMLMNGQVTVRD